ncbi:MAG: sugar ABC transporter substrate-binding protein [Firmicutes bacterium]|nr:sugar ABC transporter substrate-binding protein [Bacillota bacterium]
MLRRTFVALMLVCLLAVGLGSGLILAAEKVTITWWGHNYPLLVSMYEELIKQFEKENPDIHVEYYQKPGAQYNELVLTAIAGGSGPDVFRVGDWTINEYIRDGVVAPLDIRAFGAKTVKEVVDRFVPGVLDPFLRKEGLYAVPEDACNLLLVVNLDHLKEAGFAKPPANAVDWVTAMQKMTKVQNGRWIRSGFEWKYDHELWDTQQFTVLLRNEGTTLYNPDGTLALDKEKTIKALKYYYDSIHTAKFANPDFAATFGSISPDVFTRGFASTYTAGMWVTPLINNHKIVKNWVATDWITGPHQSTIRWSWSYGLNAASKHKLEASKFIAFLSRPDIVEKRLKLGGIVAGLKGWEESPWIQAHPEVRPWIAVLGKSRYLDRFSSYAAVSVAVSKVMQDISMGGMTPEDAYKELVAKLPRSQ